MRRTDLLDTKEWAHRRMVLGLRAKSPEWKLRKVFEMNAMWNDVLRRRTEPGFEVKERRASSK